MLFQSKAAHELERLSLKKKIDFFLCGAIHKELKKLLTRAVHKLLQ